MLYALITLCMMMTDLSERVDVTIPSQCLFLPAKVWTEQLLRTRQPSPSSQVSCPRGRAFSLGVWNRIWNHFVNKTACGNNPGNARRDQNFNQNRQKIKQNTVDKGIKNKDTNKRHIIVNKKVVYKVSQCWYYMPNPRLFLEIKFSETCFEADI